MYVHQSSLMKLFHIWTQVIHMHVHFKLYATSIWFWCHQLRVLPCWHEEQRGNVTSDMASPQNKRGQWGVTTANRNWYNSRIQGPLEQRITKHTFCQVSDMTGHAQTHTQVWGLELYRVCWLAAHNHSIWCAASQSHCVIKSECLNCTFTFSVAL